MTLQHTTEATIMRSIAGAMHGQQPNTADTPKAPPVDFDPCDYHQPKRGYVSSAVLPTSVTTYDPRRAERAALESEVEKFLKAGGKITKVGNNVTGLSGEQRAELRAANRPEKENV